MVFVRCQSIRETPLRGDVADETRSQCTLDLVGVSGAVCTLNCGPLTFDDLSFYRVDPVPYGE